MVEFNSKTMKHFLFFLAILAFQAPAAMAQKIFSEGIIRYDVFLNSNDKPDGIYVVTVKNGFTKRELSMQSGFNNIIIHNHKTGVSTSLNLDHDTKYALQLTPAEVKEKNKKFEGARFVAGQEKKKIAGYNCSASTVKYTQGDEASFFYAADLLPPNDAFNTMFPGLQGIPLEYQMKTTETTTIRFVAKAVETRTVDLSVFDIPSDYKIVTRQELESLR